MSEERKAFLLPGVRGSLCWLLLLYCLSYLFIRSSYERVGRTLLLGPVYTHTVFNKSSTMESLIYYVYLPLGSVDEMLSGQKYILDESFIEQVFE